MLQCCWDKAASAFHIHLASLTSQDIFTHTYPGISYLEIYSDPKGLSAGGDWVSKPLGSGAKTTRMESKE